MSVWEDWLNYITVVGTDKIMFEAVLAVCNGNYGLAMEKGADAALDLVLDLITGGVNVAAIGAAERLALKGIVKNVAVTVMSTMGRAAGEELVKATKVKIQGLTNKFKTRRPKIRRKDKLLKGTSNMSVWIDWLDYIPVVGTVKNMFQAVSAVCHGDYALAKEKGADAALGLVLGLITGGVNVAAIRVAERLALSGIVKKVAVTVMSTMGRAAGEELVKATKVKIQELTNKFNRPGDQR